MLTHENNFRIAFQRDESGCHSNQIRVVSTIRGSQTMSEDGFTITRWERTRPKTSKCSARITVPRWLWERVYLEMGTIFFSLRCTVRLETRSRFIFRI